MRKILFSVILLALALFVTAGVAELLIRWLNPQHVLYPRYMASAEYGLLPYANVTMTHTRPGRYRFTYRINRQHHRGRMIPVSNAYARKHIVVLGDSNSFGMGVHEGEEYPALLPSLLRDQDVINLAAPGWGLTQHIRRYYELGQLYQPARVVLQFCINDVNDDLVNMVTTIENDRFVFRDNINPGQRLKKYLSTSVLQRSQLYNFFRYRAVKWLNREIAARAAQELSAAEASAGIPPGERFYNDLLDLFARDLRQRGVRLLFLHPAGQIEPYPHIRDKVFALQREGLLDYLDTGAWLANETNAQSIEGHIWGARAHAIIAGKLAERIGGDR